MSNINSFVVSGRLTRDFGSGQYDWSENNGLAIGKMSIACNKRVKSGEEWTDGVDFLDITVYGNTAKFLKQYATKGREVVVEGRIRQDAWKDESGKSKSKLTLVAKNVQLCGKKEDSADKSSEEVNSAFNEEPAERIDFANGGYEDEEELPPF